MTPVVLAVLASYGTYLVVTGMAYGWEGLGPGPSLGGSGRRSRRRTVRAVLLDIGVEVHRPVALLGAVVAAAAAAGAASWLLFGGTLPPIVGLGAGAVAPVLGARSARERRLAAASEHWPRLIDEMRLRATSLGRALPAAVFEAAASAPREMQQAFEDARREWLLSTDFERTLGVLARGLRDPAADTVCETLLVAHEVGGSEVERVLVALAQDRKEDLEARKDARSRQAGARFARSFTLVVPLGMALVGMSIGRGRAAYASPLGQLLVVVGLAVIGACWVWAGRIMRLPVERRVFTAADR